MTNQNSSRRKTANFVKVKLSKVIHKMNTDCIPSIKVSRVATTLFSVSFMTSSLFGHSASSSSMNIIVGALRSASSKRERSRLSVSP